MTKNFRYIFHNSNSENSIIFHERDNQVSIRCDICGNLRKEWLTIDSRGSDGFFYICVRCAKHLSKLIQQMTRIKELRQKLGLSQIQFAKLAKMNVSTISQLEAGRQWPSVPTLLKLSKFFGVSIDYIVRNRVKRKNNNLQEDNFQE